VSGVPCNGPNATITITIDPEPVVATTLDDTVCSDAPVGITLAVDGMSEAAASYEIDAITLSVMSADFTAAATNASTGAGQAANVIINDEFINVTGVDQTVTYTIIPITADGCEGAPQDIEVTIEPQPVGTDDTTEICPDEMVNFDLMGTTDIAANFSWVATSNPMVGGESIVAVSSNMITDELTNATAFDQMVTYIITPTNPATGCVGEEFEIVVTVHPFPVVVNALLEQCDDDTDGFADFNLQEANVLVSADSANETFVYYETLAQATAGDMDFIPNDTMYPNAVVSSDSVWVRVSTTEGCVSIAQVDLLVTTSLIPDTFNLTFEVCDNDDDGDATNGIANFDFSSATGDILNLFPVADRPNLVVTYYETAANAQAEIDDIPDISDYDNSTPNTQLIYVRVENTLTSGCAGFGQHVTLNVVSAPNAEQSHRFCAL